MKQHLYQQMHAQQRSLRNASALHPNLMPPHLEGLPQAALNPGFHPFAAAQAGLMCAEAYIMLVINAFSCMLCCASSTQRTSLLLTLIVC